MYVSSQVVSYVSVWSMVQCQHVLPLITGISIVLFSFSSQHFEEDAGLASKLELLLEHAYKSSLLTMNEKNIAVEASSLYSMQRGDREEGSPVLDCMRSQSPVHLVRNCSSCGCIQASNGVI